MVMFTWYGIQMNTVRFHTVLIFRLHEDADEYGMKEDGDEYGMKEDADEYGMKWRHWWIRYEMNRVNGRIRYDFDTDW